MASEDGFSWQKVQQRIWSFTRNVISLEARLQEVTRKTSDQQDLINNLAERMNRIEAQHELIVRLLETRAK